MSHLYAARCTVCDRVTGSPTGVSPGVWALWLLMALVVVVGVSEVVMAGGWD